MQIQPPLPLPDLLEELPVPLPDLLEVALPVMGPLPNPWKETLPADFRLLVFSSSAVILVHFSIHLWTHCVHISIFYIYGPTNPYFSSLSAVLVLAPFQVFTSCPGPCFGLLSLFLVLVLVPEVV